MEKIKIRFSKKEDKELIISWINDEETLRWFPMYNIKEINHSVSIWMEYIDKKAVLTAEYENVACGSSLLYVSTLEKFKHHALFAIIVSKEYRGKGIGTRLLEEVKKMAKEQFKMEILHLEVYEGNPAISLYKRMGFKEYGVQKKFIKEKTGKYRDKIMMQLYL